ncbi:hypothetical protein BH10ACT1_BH10ACT1_43530 [soil metagenome]
MPDVVTLGAAYSANKGAASMLQGLVDNLGSWLGPTRVVAVSTHAERDRPVVARAELTVEVASQRPVELALVHFPLALLAGGLRTAHLPWRCLLRPAALRAIADADVVADISGISFVDGRRPVVLVYNALVDLVPLLLGRPVVKCAQAMGPFKSQLNRRLASLVLPRLAAVCPRGEATRRHLDDLGLTNQVPANDLAFTMVVPERAEQRAAELLAAGGAGPYIVVSPSQVVDTACTARDIDYAGHLAGAIDGLVERYPTHTVVIVAHSAMPGVGVNHMNDLPLCRAIHDGTRHREQVHLIDDDLLPTELRAVIGKGDVLVTSRFHAMISALAEGVPPVVIGWSHKYAEILDPFGLGEVATTYDELAKPNAVLDRTIAVMERAPELRTRIAAHLPQARAEADHNFPPLAKAVTAA